MLAYNVFIFGDLSLDGSNQIVLILSGALAAIIAYFNGVKWKILQEGMVVTLEPIIDIDDERILVHEDNFLITANGP